MLDRYKNYKDIKMPEDIKNSIRENMRGYEPEVADRPRNVVKRRVLIYAAVFALLAIVASAYILLPRYDYVVISGIMEDEHGNKISIDVEIDELYIAPQVLILNENTKIDSVMLKKFGGELHENPASSQLSIVLIDASEPDLKIITENYGEITPDFVWQQDEHRHDYSFTFFNFPNVTEFTIVNGGNSVDVILELFKGGDDFDPKGFRISDHNR